MSKIIRLAIVFILFFFISCNNKNQKIYKPKGLVKLTKPELIQKAKNHKLFEIKNTVVKDEQGNIIPLDSVNNLINSTEWITDRYVNSKGEIKEQILRKATKIDREFYIGLMTIYKRSIPIELIEIDCTIIPEILDSIRSLDQNMRLNGNRINHNIDRKNIITVVSIIEKCGMPTLKELNKKQMNTIWLVFQHTENNIRKKYFPLIEKAGKNGDLRKQDIAMMKDRILMFDGLPQIYGTQITTDKKTTKLKLYKLEKPELVNKRRKEIGFEPIQNYLDNWNIEFNIEQIDE